jgi:hypothetical protein
MRHLIAASVLVAAPAFAWAAPAFASSHVVAYLNATGVTLHGGEDDDASANSSILVGSQLGGRASIRIPSYRGGDWADVLGCVRELYAPFQIDITDERPRSGGYVMIAIGGTSDLLDYSAEVAGVAPIDGKVMDGAVGFVFERTIGDRPRAVCEAVAHELGHTLGLDHETDCRDIMSYAQCGPKTFTDLESSCGEMDGDERACTGGGDSQDSYRHLASVLGLKDGVSPPPATPPAAVDDGSDDEQDDGPAVDIDRIGVRQGRRDSVVTITLRAHADRVVLDWRHGRREDSFDCDALPDGGPVSCSRDGDDVVFSLHVGAGERSFTVRAIDEDGSEARVEVPAVTFRE